MFDTTPVGPAFFDEAPQRATVVRTFAAPAARLFATLARAEDWPRWVPVIRRADWTSPLGEGATRTVHMVGGVVADERFFDWTPDGGFSFCFVRLSEPTLDAFAERYQLTDHGDGRCTLTWTMALRGKGLTAWILALCQPMLGLGQRLLLRRLARLVEAQPG
jgi:hypothetical protein